MRRAERESKEKLQCETCPQGREGLLDRPMTPQGAVTPGAKELRLRVNPS